MPDMEVSPKKQHQPYEEDEGIQQVVACLSKRASPQSTFAESDSGEENLSTPEGEHDDDNDDDIDEERKSLFQQVEILYREEKLLEAARLLRTLLLQKDNRKRTEQYQHILIAAEEIENAIADIVGPPDTLWHRQGTSSHGDRPTVIYTRFDEHWKLTCRIETPIEANLLVPLLSVLNETDLYQTWIPSWRFPNIGVSQSTKLHHSGKANQLVQIVCDVPWPLRTREVIVQATAVDEIDERGYIVIRLNTMDDHPAVPEPEPDIVRVVFQGAILFRACPLDHELHQEYNQKNTSKEPLILISFKMFLDSKFTAVPISLVNFCTKTVIGSMWNKFLQVAEDVRDGKRPEHAKLITEKADLYEWIEARAQIMLEQLSTTK